jgi:hypothetical protein
VVLYVFNIPDNTYCHILDKDKLTAVSLSNFLGV